MNKRSVDAHIGSETLAAFNERVVELARSLKVARGRKLRVDSMVVETNIHHHTDSALPDDGVRVLSRLLRQAKKALPAEVIGRLGKEAFRTLKKAASGAQLSGCTGSLVKRTRQLQQELKEAYQKLITITQASCAQARRVIGALRGEYERGVERLLERFGHFLVLGEQGITQAARRVLEGEQVLVTEMHPTSGKVNFRKFTPSAEPHTPS